MSSRYFLKLVLFFLGGGCYCAINNYLVNSYKMSSIIKKMVAFGKNKS